MWSVYLAKKVSVLAFLVFLISWSVVSADTLSVYPATGSYSVGQEFNVSVYVSSAAVSINAVSGTLIFPPNNLEVLSVSKANSVLTLWITDPTFSNTEGRIGFEGIIPNPGFIGNNGLVATVRLKVLKEGVVPFTFKEGSVLANDGIGTNVLKNMVPATYIVLSNTELEVPFIDSFRPLPLHAENNSQVNLSVDEQKKTQGDVVSPPASTQTYIYSAFGETINILSFVIAVVALLFLLAGLIRFGYKKLNDLRGEVRDELLSTDKLIKRHFDDLRRDVKESISVMNKVSGRGKLRIKEHEILDILRDNFKDVESDVEEEISKLRKKPK